MLRRYPLTIAFVALVTLLLGAIPSAGRAQAQGQQCFPETGHCVSGRFLEYWQQNGGLPVFGYPIGPERDETSRDTGKVYRTQWFERARFELHPQNNRPYDVLLGRLGEDTLIKMGRDWRSEYESRTPPSGECEAPYVDGKIFLLCPPFREYYWSHGLEFDGIAEISPAESLALFGLPLTQPKMEVNSSGHTVLTQWFERARFEYHPNNPEPYKVLLGLLGNELRSGGQPSTSERSAITYVDQDGAVFEITADGQRRRIETMPEMGRVIDAVQVGGQIVILRAQGLQGVTVAGEPRTIATFTQGDAWFGELVAPANSVRMLYSYSRTNPTPGGFDGVVGVLVNNTNARKVHEASNSMSVLGLSKDETVMYAIDRGQDISFGQVKAVAMSDGRVLARLPFAGDGPAALSPDRELIATASMRDGHPDVVVFYDLASQTGAPRSALPRPSWNVAQLVWARDSRAVYALAYPSTDRPTGELWRVDAETLNSDIAATGLPLDARLVSLSPDGRWLLAQTVERAVIVDLSNGRIHSFDLPEEAVVARWQ